MSELPADRRYTLRAEYYVGAYGPTIRMDAKERQYLEDVRAAFMRLANGEAEQIEIEEVGEVRMVKLASFTLKLIPGKTDTRIYLCNRLDSEGDRRYALHGTSSYWFDCALLVEAMLSTDTSGHVHLTDDEIDDVLVKVAFKERKTL